MDFTDLGKTSFLLAILRWFYCCWFCWLLFTMIMRKISAIRFYILLCSFSSFFLCVRFFWNLSVYEALDPLLLFLWKVDQLSHTIPTVRHQIAFPQFQEYWEKCLTGARVKLRRRLELELPRKRRYVYDLFLIQALRLNTCLFQTNLSEKSEFRTLAFKKIEILGFSWTHWTPLDTTGTHNQEKMIGGIQYSNSFLRCHLC